MYAFLLSAVIMLGVALGAGFLLNGELQISAQQAYTTDNVRLQ
ncbi:hypothetical protein FP2506_17929 [Fulvimarina pelagi HTCC2506]|uniref:Uncharacterized protein n=1 Tax=Fulvimarina pelagi HTCC2506 TaxID=314231 RepID=Q0G147_9HYPH|nr:hypothetical protein [Fulvimarina pelagi]EAU40792.1 hypothetical protein FP2506_17929 [Fulvimarina pelagi HTCC2506]